MSATEAPQVPPLPNAIRWIDGIDVRFYVERDVDDNGVCLSYVLIIDAGHTTLPERVKGKIAIPPSELMFAQDTEALIGHHIMQMTAHVYEMFRSALKEKQSPLILPE